MLFPGLTETGGATAISEEGTRNIYCSATNESHTRENCLTGPANNPRGEIAAQGAGKGGEESVCDQGLCDHGRANTRKGARPRQEEIPGRLVRRDKPVLAARPSALTASRTRESRVNVAKRQE